MKKQKRDSDYYLQRLKVLRRDLYDDVLAGRMTVNKARQLAGLGGRRTRLNELLHAWEEATSEERSKFLAAKGLTTTPSAAPAPVVEVFDAMGFMLDSASLRIAEIMARRGMTYGQLADEIGIKRLNASVAMAMRRDVRLSPATAENVKRWLAENSSV